MAFQTTAHVSAAQSGELLAKGLLVEAKPGSGGSPYSCAKQGALSAHIVCQRVGNDTEGRAFRHWSVA